MAKLGLDPAAMGKVSSQMRAEAGKIGSASAKLDGTLRSTWWEGKDASSFKGEWEGHRKALKQVEQALNEAAKRVDKNVQQQQQASGS